MPRPNNVTNEDIARWSENIDNDPNVPEWHAQDPVLREVMYAGQWMTEELKQLKCPDELIVRIQYTTGTICFGRDIWEIHQMMINKYKNNELEFEQDPSELN